MDDQTHGGEPAGGGAAEVELPAWGPHPTVTFMLDFPVPVPSEDAVIVARWCGVEPSEAEEYGEPYGCTVLVYRVRYGGREFYVHRIERHFPEAGYWNVTTDTVVAEQQVVELCLEHGATPDGELAERVKALRGERVRSVLDGVEQPPRIGSDPAREPGRDERRPAGESPKPAMPAAPAQVQFDRRTKEYTTTVFRRDGTVLASGTTPEAGSRTLAFMIAAFPGGMAKAELQAATKAEGREVKDPASSLDDMVLRLAAVELVLRKPGPRPPGSPGVYRLDWPAEEPASPDPAASRG